MKSEHQPLKIGLFGGGRWSRVIVSVLKSLMSDDIAIFWASRHNLQTAQEFLKDRGFTGVRVSDRVEDAWEQGVDGTIVATAAYDHPPLVAKSIELGRPVLSEKPFALDFDTADQLARLAKERSCPVGVNLEFLFASYLQTFAQGVAGLDISTIEVTWTDPPEEDLYGEIKRGDQSVCITHDVFPHLWSILRVLLPRDPLLEIEHVAYDPLGLVQIRGQHARCRSTLRFSRRGDKRTRMVSIDGGAAQIDFSREPGVMTVAGRQTQLNWQDQPRPLGTALQNFLEVVQHRDLAEDWRQSIHRNMDSVRFAEESARQLGAVQRTMLDQLARAGGFKSQEKKTINLLIDWYLPTLIQSGKRIAVHSESERRRFIEIATRELGFVRR